MLFNYFNRLNVFVSPWRSMYNPAALFYYLGGDW